jgi:hypothetical protein
MKYYATPEAPALSAFPPSMQIFQKLNFFENLIISTVCKQRKYTRRLLFPLLLVESKGCRRTLMLTDNFKEVNK